MTKADVQTTVMVSNSTELGNMIFNMDQNLRNNEEIKELMDWFSLIQKSDSFSWDLPYFLLCNMVIHENGKTYRFPAETILPQDNKRTLSALHQLHYLTKQKYTGTTTPYIIPLNELRTDAANALEAYYFLKEYYPTLEEVAFVKLEETPYAVMA